jgi:hypothetical protein
MQAGDSQRVRSEIQTDDGVSLAGQIVGKETAATSYIKDAERAPGETCPEFLRDPRVAQPRLGAQQRYRIILRVVPALAKCVVDVIVDGLL